MSLPTPTPWQDDAGPLTEGTCDCSPGFLCPECSADLALLARHPDPLAQIAASTYPEKEAS